MMTHCFTVLVMSFGSTRGRLGAGVLGGLGGRLDRCQLGVIARRRARRRQKQGAIRTQLARLRLAHLVGEMWGDVGRCGEM